MSTSLQCYCKTKTTEIPLKECSAYGQIGQGGGGEREDLHLWAPSVTPHIIYLYIAKRFDFTHNRTMNAVSNQLCV